MSSAPRIPLESRERQPSIAADHERALLTELDCLIEARRDMAALYVRIDDHQIELPPSVSRLFHDLVHSLARGDAVEIASQEKALTTQEAAAILNVSRPTLVRLLDQGVIPFTTVGSSGPGAHRRVQLGDVLAYKKQREADNVTRVGRLIALTERLDLYDD